MYSNFCITRKELLVVVEHDFPLLFEVELKSSRTFFYLYLFDVKFIVFII